MSATTLTTSMTIISNAKKSPAMRVDIETPLIIMKAPKARKTNVQMNHGTVFKPPTL